MTLEELARISGARLVKSIDLNHHGTLFAGRMAEWLVEVGFMSARAALDCPPERLVCVRVSGMDFRRPVDKGATVVLTGRVAHVGRSSATIIVDAGTLGPGGERDLTTDGFITFTHIVDGRAVPHGIAVTPPDGGEARQIWDQIVNEREQRKAGKLG